MSKSLRVRPAELRDLPDIVRMLADDALGAGREKYEDPLPDSYLKAFDAITQDRNNELVVIEGEHGRAVGVMQLTFTPYITHQGGCRATIEGVRVDSSLQGTGIGRLDSRAFGLTIVLDSHRRAGELNR